jgi:predicted nucleic acid-binding protein
VIEPLSALAFEGPHKVSFWDALIVRAEGRFGAEVLDSEDLVGGSSCGDVWVISPLK